MVQTSNEKRTKRFLQDILVSDDPGNQFPIYSFDFFVVVEPDQRTFIVEDALDLAFSAEQLAGQLSEKMAEEAMLAEDTVPGHEQSIWPEKTRILWMRNSIDNLFMKYGQGFAYVSFQYTSDHEITDDLRWYLQAAYQNHPDWRVAIVGGMLEDEVIDAANFFRETGFDTTVLTRYCLSKQGNLIQNF